LTKMNNLNKLTLIEAITGLKEKKFSTKELTGDVLARIKSVEDRISSFITVNNQVLAEADKTIEAKGKISGIPYAVKEVLSTKGIKTTASSKALENYFPVYDATVVKKLNEAGGIIIGKTNCDAFAFGASTENSGYMVSKNPWNTDYVAGGSSGGSASAVVADECFFALGTDTGGSIRLPSSFCNTTGLKPTYGSCSRFGLLAMGSSFDCPGPICKDVFDSRLVFNLMKGKDSFDATSVDYDEFKKDKKTEKIIVGLPKEFFSEGIDQEVKECVLKAARILEQNGFIIKEFSLPLTKYVVEVYYIIVPSEISSNMARYDGVRFGKKRDLFENEVKRRIIIGTYSLSAGYFDQFYLKALKMRRLIQDDYLKAFSQVDCLLGPVSPTPAFKIGEKFQDPLQMYLQDILTAGVNLAGLPALALPCGFSKNNLPIGMQIIGPHFSEDLLLDIGEKFQEMTDWHKKKPTI